MRASIDSRRLQHVLKDLLDIYSPSGKEEDVCEYVFRYLKRHGASPSRQTVAGRRFNVLVLPPDKPVKVLLIGHLDTVPAVDMDSFGYEEKGDTIYGLGAADMKGGCAAMIEAYLSLLESGNDPIPAALALVVGEEELNDGIQRLVKEVHAPWAVVGEPTHLRPCFAHYGYVELELVTLGKRRHASLANPEAHAVEAMLDLLRKITRHFKEKNPEVIYNIRDLSSSLGGFAVPERCEAWLDMHVPPKAPVEDVRHALEELFMDPAGQTGDLSVTFRFSTVHPGYALPLSGRIVEKLRASMERVQLKWEPGPFPSHSDASLLWMSGVKPILLGPGELEYAHIADECVSFGEVSLAARLYADFVESLDASC